MNQNKDLKTRLASADMTDRQIIDALWQLLDNIDTLSDICKPTIDNPNAAMVFYSKAMKYAEKRFELLSSDGYRTFTQKELDGQGDLGFKKVWTVVLFDGYKGQGLNPKPMHLIKTKAGAQKIVDLSNLCDEHLASKQPCLSDEEDGYDIQWEEYEKYQRNYLVGKNVMEMSDGGQKYFILVK